MLGGPGLRITLRAPRLSGLVSRLRAWPTSSQLGARRNALVASTACAQRRVERDDVADYLAERVAADARPPVTVTTSVRRVGRR